MAFAGSGQDRTTGRFAARASLPARTADESLPASTVTEQAAAAAAAISPNSNNQIRFVASPASADLAPQLTPDLDQQLPGPDVWITATPAAIRAAMESGEVAAVLGQDIELPSDLFERMERMLVQRAQNSLGLARRAGVAVGGLEKCRAAIQTQGAGNSSPSAAFGAALALLAGDAAGGSAKKFFKMLNGQPAVIPMRCSRALSAAELGRPFDRDRQVHVIVRPGGLADRIETELLRLNAFRGIELELEPSIAGPMLEDTDE